MELTAKQEGLLRDPSLLNDLLATGDDVGSPCRIVACGLLCAGKSSLLNALGGRTGKAYFPVGAGRTTHACKELTDDVVRWVDTPGLDVSGLDDAEADKAIRTADILLFAHHPQTGELHRAEVDFLKELAGRAETRHDLAGRLCLALTHAESLNAEPRAQLAETVAAQVALEIGGDPTLFWVSSSVYIKGVREDKPKLIELSGLPALRRHLLAACAGVPATRNQRRVSIGAELGRQIDREIAEIQRQCRTLHREIGDAENALLEDFTSFLGQLYEMANEGTTNQSATE